MVAFFCLPVRPPTQKQRGEEGILKEEKKSLLFGELKAWNWTLPALPLPLLISPKAGSGYLTMPPKKKRIVFGARVSKWCQKPDFWQFCKKRLPLQQLQMWVSRTGRLDNGTNWTFTCTFSRLKFESGGEKILLLFLGSRFPGKRRKIVGKRKCILWRYAFWRRTPEQHLGKEEKERTVLHIMTDPTRLHE